MTRLGKGLEALISSGPESVDKTTGITTVKVELISPNRYQPRKRLDKEKLQELANSLKENGIIQPIIVTKRDETNYELIAGERRLEASKLAGYDKVPVIIRSVSPKEQLQFAIIENVQREDLSAIEEAKAYQQLNEDFGLTHAQISDIVGKDRATITNLIRLLKLPEEIQNMVLDEKLSSGHARTILQVPEKDQLNFANQIVRNIFSVRKAEQEAKKIKESGKVGKSKTNLRLAKELKTLEASLKTYYKTDLKISGTQNKGKIIFQYSSKEELEKLVKKLVK
ncbi:MAG: chromosome partitioning protein ParB [Candidatus Cloacimonadota bacterium]|nr:MAG: chromosome partitioning protein ParB [Candidatus Cloacimonadota bacterium]RLC53812.1 MAG: chromosome partitioning protein ParB [Candidatus Cloacimonadota bacterium]